MDECLYYNRKDKQDSPLPGVPAWLAPTEKLCSGAAPNDRLRDRPPPLLGRGEEGALRDEKLSAVRSTGQWRERNSNYNNLGEWISFLLTAFAAEKNTVQVHQLVGRSLKTKILIHQS